MQTLEKAANKNLTAGELASNYHEKKLWVQFEQFPDVLFASNLLREQMVSSHSSENNWG